jgi:hypothetical protein
MSSEQWNLVRRGSFSTLPGALGKAVNVMLEPGEVIVYELNPSTGAGLSLTHQRLLIVRGGYTGTGAFGKTNLAYAALAAVSDAQLKLTSSYFGSRHTNSEISLQLSFGTAQLPDWATHCRVDPAALNRAFVFVQILMQCQALAGCIPYRPLLVEKLKHIYPELNKLV